MGISNHYKALGRKEKSLFIQRVIEVTEVSYPSFMNKIKDDEKWSKLEREAIEKIIEEETKNERSGIL